MRKDCTVVCIIVRRRIVRSQAFFVRFEGNSFLLKMRKLDFFRETRFYFSQDSFFPDFLCTERPCSINHEHKLSENMINLKGFGEYPLEKSQISISKG